LKSQRKRWQALRGSEVQDPIEPSQIARLEEGVASDPGAPEFAGLGEALRRAGRLRDAEDVLRRGVAHKPGSLEGTLVLALVLLDQGRGEEARAALLARSAQSLESLGLDQGRGEAGSGAATLGSGSDFSGEVTDGEFERAFAAAKPDLDQLVDADGMAQAAMRDASLDDPELDSPAAPDPIFATRTMAELLDRQGDAAGAARIRGALAPDERAEDSHPKHSARSRRILATLETWLNNLRREPR
jgi:hypothetical protein